MKKIKLKLKCHTPWSRIPSKNDYAELRDEEFFKRVQNDEIEYREYSCLQFKLYMNNMGEIVFVYNEDITEEQFRIDAFIFTNFVSLCNDFNCEFEPMVVIDDKETNDFFSYPKETDYGVDFVKDKKFYDIGMEDFADFNKILSNLYGEYKDYYANILASFTEAFTI